MNKHLFEISIIGTELRGTVSFKSISEKYRNTEMIQLPNGNFQLIITKRDSYPDRISIEEAKFEANELVDRMALLPNHYISSLKYIGYKKGDDILVEAEQDVEYSATMIGTLENPNEYYNQKEIKEILNKNDDLGILRIYRTTLSINDRISQYLIFYGLLLIMKSEKQKKVDEFIKSKIPDILVVAGKNGDETIITRIRNMIAHPSNDRDITQLNKNVKTYLGTLKNLVLNELRE
nr:hypothetical protein [uncultured Draconibacterium sp.]